MSVELFGALEKSDLFQVAFRLKLIIESTTDSEAEKPASTEVRGKAATSGGKKREGSQQ
jgi:hypothetical protein